MTTERNVEPMLRRWLVDGVDEMPEGVYLTILDRVERQPQRRAWRVPWRDPHVNTYLKPVAAVAAAIVIAVVGFNLLRGGGSQVGGGPVASPSPALTAPPSPNQSPESGTWPLGELPAKRYSDVMVEGVRFSFALPSDRWRSVAAGELLTGTGTPHTPREDDYAWMFLPGGNIDAVATDPCNGEAVVVDGSSIDDLAAALATIPGMSAEQPVDTTLAGLPATLVTLTVDPDPPCDINSFWLWGQRSLHPNSVDSIIRIWITNVDGQRHAVFTDQASADPRVEREIQQIIDSYRLE
jgi:hypothetical protein